MISLETRQAYTEVTKILELIGESYSSKVPDKIKSVFQREMDTNYFPLIDINKSVKSQNLKRKTVAIISALNLQYWCIDENKKQELKKSYYENGINLQKELQDKYNPNNIFMNRKVSNNTIENETAMVVYEELPLFKRIYKKIKSFFTKVHFFF